MKIGRRKVRVRFSSAATEPITMFGDSAIQLIQMLGASYATPGAIAADDIPQAIQRLRQALQAYAAHLLGLLERAGVANVPLVWEVA